MLIERNEGILERCLVSGVTGIEILASHVTTQFLVMCFQTTLVLIFSFSVFDLTLRGELLWVVLLVMETGLCGMCFGLLSSNVLLMKIPRQKLIFIEMKILFQALSFRVPLTTSGVQRTWPSALSCLSSCCAESFGPSRACIPS